MIAYCYNRLCTTARNSDTAQNCWPAWDLHCKSPCLKSLNFIATEPSQVPAALGLHSTSSSPYTTRTSILYKSVAPGTDVTFIAASRICSPSSSVPAALPPSKSCAGGPQEERSSKTNAYLV